MILPTSQRCPMDETTLRSIAPSANRIWNCSPPLHRLDSDGRYRTNAWLAVTCHGTPKASANCGVTGDSVSRSRSIVINSVSVKTVMASILFDTSVIQPAATMPAPGIRSSTVTRSLDAVGASVRVVPVVNANPSRLADRSSSSAARSGEAHLLLTGEWSRSRAIMLSVARWTFVNRFFFPSP